jgi:aryl-alcohol dehydrogenase-like predicted oxidoreductase
MTARLVLGTAQFGLEYGIVNRNGKLSDSEAGSILSLARRAGVDCIDTAPAYGDAEEVLGRLCIKGFNIVSKVRALRGAQARDAIASSGWRSIERLRCGRLHGLLIHAADDLTGPFGDKVYAGLLAARDAGITERIGVSVYDPAELEVVFDRFPVDIVQCPFSVVDQRFGESIARMADHGIAAHVRSVFLQGLLLQPPDSLPPRFAPMAENLTEFHARLEHSEMRPLEAALAFARDWPGVECVVVGATSGI